ncbi:MAG TPA: 2-dehydropantoate 2-reductase [Solirubrobacteraceae bacterium]|jgi:2-dehydropantoate 2-reductase
MTAAAAVLGAGGVGGFVAAALTRSGADVVVVARPQTAAALEQAGEFRVSSRALGEDFRAQPPVVTELSEPVDVLFVATKATGLADALERVQTPPSLVVPLLNGLEHLEVLRARFGAQRVAAAVIRIESDRPSAGVIVQTSPGVRVDMAPPSETSGSSPASALDMAGQLLRAAGIEVRTGDSPARVMWSKLARLCALALTTSASDRPIGYVRSDPRWRSALEGAVTETVAVANAEGAGLAAADTLAELDAAHADLGSSMQRDLAAGRPTELDAIAGAVLRAGRRHGLRCPTVQWLAERVALRAARAVA